MVPLRPRLRRASTRPRARRWLLAAVASVLPATAVAAETELTDAQRAQLETLRGEVAAQIQLQAYDLLDELVYSWIEQPPFALETPVVLADVSVPVGFGSGMQSLVENHIASLLTRNPRTRVVLSHCPACTAVVVHSGAKGTIVARGFDEPGTLAAAGNLAGSRHALFLDFEAEGSSLVLRARITGLEPALPIVYAKTLSTSTASPALLRSGETLKSAAGARQEYLDALRGRSVYLIPFRLVVRTYASGDLPVVSPPFAWFQAGFEGAFTQARAWTGGISVGFSYAPELHTGWMVQGRIARLLTGPATSLTRPDLYLFFGVSAIDLRGGSAAVFQENDPTLENLLADGRDEDLHDSFGAVQIGLELRVKNRIAAGLFLETLPSKNDAPAIGDYLDVGFADFESIGTEVSFCF